MNNIFQLHFIIFARNKPKMITLGVIKLWTVLHKDCQRTPGKFPRRSQDYCTVLSWKNIFDIFHHFRKKYEKMMSTTVQKFPNNILKKLSGRSRKRPREVPGLSYSPFLANIFPSDFIIFARNIFHHFETSRQSFLTLWCHQELILYGTQLIYIYI